MTYFSSADPFNALVPHLDPNNAIFASFFAKHAGSANLAMDQTWGIPTYQGTLGDSYVTAIATKYNPGVKFGLRLPAGAKPQVYDSNGYGEGKMVVLGPVDAHGVQYETDFFGLGDSKGVFQFNSLGYLMAENVWQQQCGVGSSSTTVVQQGVLGHPTGGGVMQGAGLIRATEIQAGVINHALAVTIPETLDRALPNAFRSPANQTDGEHNPGVPMGAHIQLDPTYDISTLNPVAQIVAKALQQYGAYLIDTGGSLSFYAESSLSGVYPTGFDPHAIRAIDWTRLGVLAS